MLAFEAVSLINWLVKSLRSAMFPGCPSLATGLWPPCQGSEQPAGLFLCYSSSEVGFVEWEVQSSWTGCGAPPPPLPPQSWLAAAWVRMWRLQNFISASGKLAISVCLPGLQVRVDPTRVSRLEWVCFTFTWLVYRIITEVLSTAVCVIFQFAVA